MITINHIVLNHAISTPNSVSVIIALSFMYMVYFPNFVLLFYYPICWRLEKKHRQFLAASVSATPFSFV